MQDRTSLPRTPPTVLTTRALVLGRDAALLLTLGLLAPTVVVIRVPIVGAHRSVGPITDDTVAGTAGAASAGQAHSTEPARLWALVWGAKRSEGPAYHASPHLGMCRGSVGTREVCRGGGDRQG